MNQQTYRDWLKEEGVGVDAIDAPDGYDFVDRISIGGVNMLLAQAQQHPAWRLETRIEVQFGDHQIDDTGRAKLKLHLRSVFQMRNVDYEIDDTDDGISATITRYLYPENITRQSFMDELRALQHGGLLISGDVDRFVVGLI